MRITTNISTSMVRDWTVSQAVAELLQNALDARKAGADMSITRDGGMLTIADTGPGLSKRHLALGISEKSADSAGQFGLGMKESWLVLAREGRVITTTTTGMTITPSIADVGLDVPCLVMDIADNNQVGGTCHVVECTEGEEAAAKAHFSEWQAINWVDEAHGLSTPGGSIYVNGVLCGAIKDAVFSYHLSGKDAQALNNSDRHAIDVDAAAGIIASSVPYLNQAAAEMLLPCLTANLTCWEQTLWPSWLTKATWQPAISAVWGKRVVITDDAVNVDRMRYLGYVPIHICNRWRWAVASLCVPLAEAQAALAKQARIDAELSKRESAILRAALDRLDRHGVTIDPSIVHVARTLSLDSGVACDGLRIGPEIWLAAHVLKTAWPAVLVLVHEYVHLTTDAQDCSAEFQQAQERVWFKIAFGREP